MLANFSRAFSCPARGPQSDAGEEEGEGPEEEDPEEEDPEEGDPEDGDPEEEDPEEEGEGPEEEDPGEGDPGEGDPEEEDPEEEEDEEVRSGKACEWEHRVRECIRAEHDVIHEEAVDNSPWEAVEREQKLLRKSRRASCRRSRCARREAEWARRTEAAAERNEQLARRVLPSVAPRPLLRDASPGRVRLGRRARGKSKKDVRLGQLLTARAASAVDSEKLPARAPRAAAAAAPDASSWTVGDAALRAACVLVALGACPVQDDSRVVMTRKIAVARWWRQRDVFARELPDAPDLADPAAAVVVARWFCSALCGLSARTCGGRRVCARRFSPGVGIGGAKCRAARECKVCVGDVAVRAACAMIALGASAAARCAIALDGDVHVSVGGVRLARPPRARAFSRRVAREMFAGRRG